MFNKVSTPEDQLSTIIGGNLLCLLKHKPLKYIKFKMFKSQIVLARLQNLSAFNPGLVFQKKATIMVERKVFDTENIFLLI